MPETSSTRGRSGAFIVGAMVLFIVLAVGALILLANQDRAQRGAAPVDDTTLTASTYMDVVEPLLASADAAQGPEVLRRHGCLGCHAGSAAANGLAPSFAGLRDQLAERRPPLQPEAYLYEAIVYPDAHRVEGYMAQMPVSYGDLSETDLGAMIAYLLEADIQQ